MVCVSETLGTVDFVSTKCEQQQQERWMTLLAMPKCDIKLQLPWNSENHPVLFINVGWIDGSQILDEMRNTRIILKKHRRWLLLIVENVLNFVKPNVCFLGFMVRDAIYLKSLNRITFLDLCVLSWHFLCLYPNRFHPPLGSTSGQMIE